jgi:hypothetical protein
MEREGIVREEDLRHRLATIRYGGGDIILVARNGDRGDGKQGEAQSRHRQFPPEGVALTALLH